MACFDFQSGSFLPVPPELWEQITKPARFENSPLAMRSVPGQNGRSGNGCLCEGLRMPPLDGDAAHTGGRRTQTSKGGKPREVAGRWCVRRYGDLEAGGLWARCIERLFGN